VHTAPYEWQAASPKYSCPGNADATLPDATTPAPTAAPSSAAALSVAGALLALLCAVV
jgi:hypothetical protein